MGTKEREAHDNHSIEKLLEEYGVPWNGALNFKLIERVFLLQLRNLCRSQSILNVGVKSSCHVCRCQKEWMLVEVAGHCEFT